MTSLRGRIVYFFLVIMAFMPVGCMLEDPVVQGDVCPPGDMRNVNDELYVSFATLDCYKDYVVFAGVSEGALESCVECEAKETMLGTVLKCESVSKGCLEVLSKDHQSDYVDCNRYRDHLVFDSENPGKNRISFVLDYENKIVKLEDVGITDNTRYCPLEYRSCRYNDKLVEAPFWFGCYQPCEMPFIYCEGRDGNSTCIDPRTDTWHCGAKGTCSDSEPISSNWGGVVCSGGICQDGICKCPEDKGYASCGDVTDSVCYDIMHDRSHCGEQCIACNEGLVCVDGVCKEDYCGVGKNLCHTVNGTCENSLEACGPSCMNCKNVLNLASSDSVSCNKDTGVCEIKACESGYHIELDSNNSMKQVCRPNTLTACAPPTQPKMGTIDEQIKNCYDDIENAEKVICNNEGQCEATQCKTGYRLKDIYCEENNCAKSCGDNELCIDSYCRCKQGYTYCGEDIGCVDILRDKKHCGGCEPEDVCDKDNGSAFYKCEFGVCMLDYCAEGYHAYNDDCELNDDENCGWHENNCSLIEHKTEESGECVEGKCIYQCEKGFHVYDEGEKSLCEENNIENCLEHDKKCQFANQDTVVCKDEEGCLVEKCVSGYHVYLNECESDDLKNCRKHGLVCIANSVCDPENGCQCADGFDACKEGEDDLCVDFMTDHAHCGKCNHVCPDNADCIDSDCVCTTTGLSYCGDSNSCVNLLTDDNNCGVCGKVCGKDSKCCNGKCEDIRESPNCGGCNNVCNDGKVCIDKSCKCKDGDGWCSDQCVSLATNNNCGKCGIVCDGTERVCKSGKCECKKEGTGWCGGKCIDIMSDIKNCGGCNKECNVDHATNSCKAGICEYKCEKDYHKYEGKCEADSNTHCGSHGNACTGGKNCIDATCQCPSGQTDCGGTCVDTKTNSSHCGSCNNKCTGGKSCSGGSCKCPSSQTDCGGTCVDTSSNGSHCGGCNNKCTGGKSCSGGSCKCPSSQTDCGGTCVDTNSNGSHCGGCNNKCTGGKSCSGGSCKCPSGQKDCGGTCVDTSTDGNHCGGCNNACGTGKYCSGGSCKCSSGTDCGGSCVDLNSNSTHCGSCNNSCGTGKYCNSGSCQCSSGTDCGGSCVDLSSNSTHCGSCYNSCARNNADYGCSYGSCWYTCWPGKLDCGGCVGADVYGYADTSGGVNVRKGPGKSSYGTLGAINYGDYFYMYGYVYGETISGNNIWYVINYNGSLGYVSGKYVTITLGTPQWCNI